MRDYNALHIIRDSGLPQDVISVLQNAFTTLCNHEEPNGCLSTGSAIFIALSYLGYRSSIRMGVVEVNGQEFYHAWLELNGKVIGE